MTGSGNPLPTSYYKLAFPFTMKWTRVLQVWFQQETRVTSGKTLLKIRFAIRKTTT